MSASKDSGTGCTFVTTRAIMISVVGCIIACGGPQNPAVRTETIELDDAMTGAAIAIHQLGAPFPYVFSGKNQPLVPFECIGNLQLTHSFDCDTNNRTDCPGQFKQGTSPELVKASEVHFYERDLQDVQDTLETLIHDPADWDIETDAGHLPADVSFSLPSLDVNSVSMPVLSRFLASDFFIGGTPIDASLHLGGCPAGEGSAKAVRRIERGMCSNFTPLSTIFTPLVDCSEQTFVVRAVGRCDCADVIRNYAHAVPYLQQTGNPVLAGGGFYYNYRWRVVPDAIASAFASPSQIDATFKYDFVLNSGILGVIPDEVDIQTSGSVNSDDIRAAMNQSIPDGIAQSARTSQTIFFPAAAWLNGGVGDPSCDTDDQCLPKAAGLASTGIGLEAMNNFAGTLGLSAAEANTAFKSWGNGRWVCAPTAQAAACSAQPMGGKECAFIAQATRLNVMADGVELVWFDDRKDIKNPVFGLWLWLREVENAPQIGADDRMVATTREAQLCTPNIPSGDSTGRPPKSSAFTILSRGQGVLHQSSNLACDLLNCH